MKKSDLVSCLFLSLTLGLCGCLNDFGLTRDYSFHDFYGKVIDQNGNPIPDVEVTAELIVSDTMFGAVSAGPSLGVYRRTKSYQAKSDANGQFQFRNLYGKDLGVGVKKNGYVWSGHGEMPDNVQSVPNSRDVFIMYKLQGAESMVHMQRDIRILYDGTSALLNLFTGDKNDSGDLKITVTRNPLQVKRGQQHFAWIVKVEVVSGGIIISKDLYPYEAPQNGYQDALEINEAADAPNWTQRLIEPFYVHTKNGNYGRMVIDLTMDSDRPGEGIGGSIEAYMNPASDSRNLEFDPAKEIRPNAQDR